ncbi:MFS transporter [Micromonospora coerulea]|uniref:MFS transporter n=1 Tax=Micromonospora coerulea TaxID=47856 RepID=UPI0019046AD2|nr:MFS transporter [Micromonospora veneta]
MTNKIATPTAAKEPGLLRTNRDFRQFWSSQGLVAYGSQVGLIALPLIAITTLQAGAEQVGVLVALQRISFPLIGLFVGVWLDRVDRRKALISGDIGQALLLTAIVVVWWRGLLSLPVLIGLAALAGALYVVSEIGHFAFLPDVLSSPKDLLSANTYLQVTASTAMIVGPSAAGLLVSLLEPTPTLLVNAAMLFLSAMLLTLMRTRTAARTDGPRPAEGVLAGIRAGIATVYQNPTLRALGEMAGIYMFFYTAFQTLVILFLVETLKLSSLLVGVFFAAFGGGFLLTSLVGRRISGRLGVGRSMVLGALVGDVASVLVSAIPGGSVTVAAVLAAACAAVMGAGTQINTVNAVSMRQGLTPPHLQGRVNATMRVIAWGVAPLGGLLGGVLGGQLGVRTGLAVAAAGTILAAVRLAVSPAARLQTLPD